MLLDTSMTTTRSMPFCSAVTWRSPACGRAAANVAAAIAATMSVGAATVSMRWLRRSGGSPPNDARASRRHRSQAEHHREQVHAHGGFGPAIGEDDMPVGDVAKFVRDHALDFVRIVCRLQQARMDIDGLAARDERVDRIVVD